jgi:hypothetical protein
MNDERAISAASVREAICPSRATDVGVVLFRESMQLSYANDEARSYMTRAVSMDGVLSRKEDLRLAIVKLGVRVRSRGTDGMRALPDGVLATQIVRTQQGLFRLRALEVPNRDQEVGQHIMIVIEDCRQGRPPSTGTLAP